MDSNSIDSFEQAVAEEEMRLDDNDVTDTSGHGTSSQIWKIECLLRDNVNNTDSLIKKMACNMQEKFNKYWEHYSVILAMGAIFDPRMKCQFLKRCLNELDGNTSKEKLDNVKKKTHLLFKAYQSNSKSLSTGTTSLGNATSSQHNIFANEKEKDLEMLDDFYDFDESPEVEEDERKSYLDMYLDEEKLKMIEYPDMDVIGFWKENRHRFRDLAHMACDVLSIPITTVASESSFSIGSRILDKYRSRLLPSNVQALICARSWIKGFAMDIKDNGDDGNEIVDEATTSGIGSNTI